MDADVLTDAVPQRFVENGGASPDARQQLDAGLVRLDVQLGDAQKAALLDYLALLGRWNTTYNLTAIRDPLDMVALHLLDSLAIQPWLARRDASNVVDVGTGAGLPGIPLAIANPHVRFTLVDAVAKKIAFVRQAATSLRLANVAPIHRRVEVLTLPQMPEVIVSRAFKSLAAQALSFAHLCSDATAIVALKGAVPHDEIAALPPSWTVTSIEMLDVPFIGAERCAVILGRRA